MAVSLGYGAAWLFMAMVALACLWCRLAIYGCGGFALAMGLLSNMAMVDLACLWRRLASYAYDGFGLAVARLRWLTYGAACLFVARAAFAWLWRHLAWAFLWLWRPWLGYGIYGYVGFGFATTALRWQWRGMAALRWQWRRLAIYGYECLWRFRLAIYGYGGFGLAMAPLYQTVR